MRIGRLRTATSVTARLAEFIAILLLVAGCASAPKPTITAVQIVVQVGPEANPDAHGRPSPVMLRLFELKSLAGFESADFFTLSEKAPETLGPELVARADLPLQPKETRSFDRVLQSDTRFIGVLAEFRELERAQWRSALAVPLGKTTPVTIRIETNSVSIKVR